MNVENEHGSDDLIDESEPATDLLSQYEDILNQIESEDDEESEDISIHEQLFERLDEITQSPLRADSGDELGNEQLFEKLDEIAGRAGNDSDEQTDTDVQADLGLHANPDEESEHELLAEPEEALADELLLDQDDEQAQSFMLFEPEELLNPEKQAGPEEQTEPGAPAKLTYPEGKLSEKQLEALQKVIGPSAMQVPGQMDISLGDTNPLGKLAAQTPIKIESGNKNLVKSVFLTIFLVLIVLAAAAGGFYYYWTTYATFEYEVQPVVVLKGQKVEANDFLYPGEIMQGISAVLQDPGFETNVGMQYVPITLTKDLRTVETAAALYVLIPIEYRIHEFREEGIALRAVDMISNVDVVLGVRVNVGFIEDPLPPSEYSVGDHILKVALNDIPFEVILRVVDTTPPTATPVDVTINIGEEVTPEQFIENEFDASGINSISFALEPNVNIPENQQVIIAIDDIYGNIAEFKAELFVILNQDPPTLFGVPDVIESGVGEEVDYFPVDTEITALDDFGRPLVVSVDDTDVDWNEEGTYTAIYFAEDNSGLRSEILVTVHIIALSPDDIMQQVNQILGSILNDRMNQVQKSREIMNWIRANITASSNSAESDTVLAGAAKALLDKEGDFHVYYSIAELLLTEAGIPNMRIDRVVDAATPHIWNLVNADERGWHHFDSFPNALGYSRERMSRFTDSEAEGFTRQLETRHNIKDYYKYDSDLYPEIVKQ